MESMESRKPYKWPRKAYFLGFMLEFWGVPTLQHLPKIPSYFDVDSYKYNPLVGYAGVRGCASIF